jgi:hypothetical protein
MTNLYYNGHDGKVYFSTEDAECTNVDLCQWQQKITENYYSFVQAVEPDKIAGMLKGKVKLENINGMTNPEDWYQGDIDLTDYTADEVAEALAERNVNIVFNSSMENTNEYAKRKIARALFEKYLDTFTYGLV